MNEELHPDNTDSNCITVHDRPDLKRAHHWIWKYTEIGTDEHWVVCTTCGRERINKRRDEFLDHSSQRGSNEKTE